MSVMGLILAILLIFVIGGLAYWAIGKVGSVWGLPAPVVVTAQVVVVILLVALFLERSGLLAGRL